MVMDVLRSYMFSRARLLRDSDTETLIRWYPCRPDAKPYPGWHAFGSPVWEEEPRDEFPGPGVLYREQRWAPKRYRAPPGIDPCGDPDWFLHGIPPSELEDTEASCADCRIRQEDPCEPCVGELEEDCTNLRVEFYRLIRAAFGLRFGFSAATGQGVSFAQTLGLRFGFSATEAAGFNRATVSQTFGLRFGFSATEAAGHSATVSQTFGLRFGFSAIEAVGTNRATVSQTFGLRFGFAAATSSGHSATVAQTFGLRFGFAATEAVGFGHTVSQTFGLRFGFSAATSSGSNRATVSQTFGLKFGFSAATSSGAGAVPARTSLGTAMNTLIGQTSITVTGITLNTGDTLVLNYGILNNTSGSAATWNSNTMSGPFDCPLAAGATLSGSCGVYWYTNTGSNATGSVVLNVNSGTAAFLVSLVKVTGITGTSDDFVAAAANTGQPDSGPSAGTTQAAEYVQGVILLLGNLGLPGVGTWGNSFTSGGQDIGGLAGLGAAELVEGYRILSATGTFDAAMTGSTQVGWAAGATSLY